MTPRLPLLAPLPLLLAPTHRVAVLTKRALADGSSGWALSCGSARVLADQLAGRDTGIDAAALSPQRLPR